jgi:hypothetical protein
MKKILIVFYLLLNACVSASFKAVGENEYQLTKMSDACAIGSPSSVLNHLNDESIKFCAGRKEKPEILSSDTTMGIPAIRCTSATITFKCVPFN